AAFDDNACHRLDQKKNLKILKLNRTRVTGVHFNELCDKLQKLYLSGCQQLDGYELVKLRHLKALSSLDVSHTPIGGYAFEYLDATALRKLNVEGCTRLADEAMSTLTGLPYLEELNLIGTQLNYKWLPQLTQLKKLIMPPEDKRSPAMLKGIRLLRNQMRRLEKEFVVSQDQPPNSD
ncbi:MAG TPA: hypothetical protein VN457_08195, partial [Chlamydiales bacterium]|nr:hypothetical protein [Chlamydiales bacterium]